MYWFWFQFQPERNLKSNFYSIPKKIRLVCQRTKIFVFGIWNSTEFVRLNIFLSNEEDFLFYIFFYSSKFRHQIVFFFFKISRKKDGLRRSNRNERVMLGFSKIQVWECFCFLTGSRRRGKKNKQDTVLPKKMKILNHQKQKKLQNQTHLVFNDTVDAVIMRQQVLLLLINGNKGFLK